MGTLLPETLDLSLEPLLSRGANLMRNVQKVAYPVANDWYWGKEKPGSFIPIHAVLRCCSSGDAPYPHQQVSLSSLENHIFIISL